MTMSFSRHEFKKNWNNRDDFPTVQTGEAQVRADMQALHDETKDALNRLADELEASTGASSIGATDEVLGNTNLQALMNYFAATLRNHVDVDPGNITAQNVGLLRELADKYGLTDKLAPTVHDALEVLERWAKLQPETAATFGLDDGATLDDALKQVRSELNSGYPQIGDTLTTVRTDLDDSWLLCNGSSVRAEGYDGLAAVLVDTWPKQAFDKLFDTNGNIAYENGTWVKCGLDSNRQIVVYFKNELTEPWSRVETGITLTTTRQLGDIHYTGGRWLIRIDHVRVSGYNGGHSMCAAENIAGPWRFSEVFTFSSGLASIGKTVFADGYYVLPVVLSSSDIPATSRLHLYYADDAAFEAGTWPSIKSIKTIDDSKGSACSAQLFFGNGTWVLQSNLVTRDAASGNYVVDNRALQMAENFAGPWSDIPNPGALGGLEYVNGQWEATVGAEHSRAWSVDLTSGWTIDSEQWGRAPVSGYVVERGVEFYGGTVDRSFCYRTLGGDWKINKQNQVTSTDAFAPVACVDGEIFFSNGYQVGRLPPGFVLPAISDSDAYVYIKAKEGGKR